MKWIKKLLGLRPIDIKQKEVESLRKKAMIAQRSGDIRAYADISKNIEDIEDEIVDIINRRKE